MCHHFYSVLALRIRQLLHSDLRTPNIYDDITELTLCVVIPDPFNTSMTWLFKKQFQLIRRLAHFHTIADNVVNASAEMQCPVCICMLCTHTLLPQREKCMQCTLGGCRQQPLSRDSRRQIAIARRCSLHFCLFFSKNLTQFRIHSCIPTKGWFRSTNLFWWLNRTECPFCSCSLPLWLRDKNKKIQYTEFDCDRAMVGHTVLHAMLLYIVYGIVHCACNWFIHICSMSCVKICI